MESNPAMEEEKPGKKEAYLLGLLMKSSSSLRRVTSPYRSQANSALSHSRLRSKITDPHCLLRAVLRMKCALE